MRETKSKAQRCLASAHAFLVNQTTSQRRAWGNAPGDAVDPWPTGHIVYHLPAQEFRDVMLGAMAWLKVEQLPNGSWGTATYELKNDIGATADVLIALGHHLGPKELSFRRGLSYLCDSYENGWPLSSRFMRTKLYSTAAAIRALSRSDRTYIPSMILPDACSALLDMRNPDGGWPQVSGLMSDPCFTAFALVALLDVSRLWGLEIPEAVFQRACEFLLSAQCANGSWTDWHGMPESPDATGNIILTLLSCGFIPPQDTRIIEGVEFICRRQLGTPGGWGLPPVDGRASPLNWVTCYSMIGLQAFVQAINSLEDQITVRTGSRRAQAFRQLDHIKEVAPPPYEGRVNLREFYGFPSDAVVPFPLVRALDATMADAVSKYVGKKLPTEEIKKALSNNNRIMVLGCLSEHFTEHPDWFQYEECVEIIFKPPHKEPRPDEPRKRFNTIRPRFYWARRKDDAVSDLVCTVFPGRDYVLQYASLIRHAAAELKHDFHAQFNIVRYPHVEATVASWTELDEHFVSPKDVVVIGYVDELERHVAGNHKFERLAAADEADFIENEFYISTRYRNKDTNTVINFLGVKFSFWGSIAEVLSAKLCALQVNEIIYFAKLGTLTENNDIYRTPFFGRDYFIVDYNRLRSNIKSLRNHLAEHHKVQRAGRHVSVPTVLEEDYHQRAILTELRIETIDNEISKIARAVETNNRLASHHVRFSPIHFATDYIRSVDEKLESTHSDLSKDHTAEARAKKKNIIDEISTRIITPYLETI